MLPKIYTFLETEPQPPIIRAILPFYGLEEAPGRKDNPIILGWAKEFGITWYTHDSTPWCGLGMGKWLKLAGYIPPSYLKLLAADSFAHWGIPVAPGHEQTGDLIIIWRPGGGHHVAALVAYDKETYHGLGGNTGDKVAIARLDKARKVAIVRPPGVQEVYPLRFIESTAALSTNEK